VFALKPMNCPGHIQMFNAGLKSYRDLPLRMASSARCIATSPPGRCTADARARLHAGRRHIFCTEEQMEQECKDVVALMLDIYKDFGFENHPHQAVDAPG
jgi:threonyl-tRNA synthetase